MKPRLLDLLCCPSCRRALTLTAPVPDDGDVLTGALRCVGCGATYPIRNGVPRFVGGDGYVGSFSYEWQRWARVQLDTANGTTESEDTFIEKTGYAPDDLRGKVVLDAGCGSGRFLDVASRWGAEAVGVDFSFAVDAAQTNVGSRPNVSIVQADLFRLPFREGAFDAVFSIGVLHHTSDTRTAFLALPPLLKESGTIAVWLYHYPDRLYAAASDFWRAVFRHAPHRLLYAWCWLLVTLFSDLYRLPMLAKRPWSYLPRLLPVNNHPLRNWRVLDTFDWYSPRYQDKECSVPRTLEWFREAGVRDAEVLDTPTAIRGRKTSDATVPEVRWGAADLRGKRVLLFGAGAAGQQAIESLRRQGYGNRIVAVCDNDPRKQGAFFRGYGVRRFADIPRSSFDVVIIASLPGQRAIAAQLTQAGLVTHRDFVTWAFIEAYSWPVLSQAA